MSIMELLVTMLIGGLVAVGLWLAGAVHMESGPNCPGMDPAWLGWCEEVQK